MVTSIDVSETYSGVKARSCSILDDYFYSRQQIIGNWYHFLARYLPSRWSSRRYIIPVYFLAYVSFILTHDH